MKVLPRQLSANQRCQIWIHNVETAENALLLETNELLLEAPNWTLQGDALILNGAGVLWRIPVGRPELQPIAIDALPPINNDHVLDPDGEHIFLSAYDDWQIYRAPLAGGTAVRVTGDRRPQGADALPARRIAGWHATGLRRRPRRPGRQSRSPSRRRRSTPSVPTAQDTGRSPAAVCRRTGQSTAPTACGCTSTPRPSPDTRRSRACGPTARS